MEDLLKKIIPLFHALLQKLHAQLVITQELNTILIAYLLTHTPAHILLVHNPILIVATYQAKSSQCVDSIAQMANIKENYRVVG